MAQIIHFQNKKKIILYVLPNCFTLPTYTSLVLLFQKRKKKYISFPMALRGHESEFMNLREWDRRARLIRDKQTSRRFSASYVGSFREDHHKSSSTRTNFNNISSTASSPGYNIKGGSNSTTLFLYLYELFILKMYKSL